MTDREAMKMALEALEWNTAHRDDDNAKRREALTALRQALAQPEQDATFTNEGSKQEPVARFNWNEAKFEWLTKYSYDKHHMKPLYLAPPSKPWVGLTS